MARASERIGSALAQHGYEPVRTVGEGSFGKAILVQPVASSAQSDEKAIVKMIDISRASKKERDDALQESQVLSSLKHPNIVRYRNNFLAEGWLCIVMDFCEGGDLSSRIKKTRAQGKTFSEAQVLWWFTQGIQALKYIHDMHILHRDLKSGNFFLSKSGNIKMGDFGIAKVLECTAACAQTQVGTPYYLCPEICKGKPYSWGSDIWAMGCILHELCALRVPFDGHDLKSLIQRITKAPTPDLPSAYSKDLQDLLNKLLNRNPGLRPQADDILEIPVVRDMVRKINKQESESEPQGSEANSEAAQRPQSVVSSAVSSGQYSDSAGTFSKRDKVEYHSATHREWLPATITDVDSEGQILMDVKPNTWISIEVQAEKVRPRKNASAPEPKAPKRHSVAAAAPRNVRPGSGAARDAQPQSARRRNSAPQPSARPECNFPPRQGKQEPLGMRRPSSARNEAGAGPKYRSPRVGGAAHLGA